MLSRNFKFLVFFPFSQISLYLIFTINQLSIYNIIKQIYDRGICRAED